MKIIILFCALAVALADFNTNNCAHDPDQGMCRGYFEKYFYDYKSKSCKVFVYGGCGGNDNRFDSEEECEDNCGGVEIIDVDLLGSESVCDLPPKAGLCDAYFPRYYFDKDMGRCQKFVYGGCGGNGNNFRTEEECNKRCSKKAMAPPALCLLDKDTGPCSAHVPRFYFNKETGMCEEFVYGGCLGNINNFNTKEECEGICR